MKQIRTRRRTLGERAIGACYEALEQLTTENCAGSIADRVALVRELQSIVRAHKAQIRRQAGKEIK